MIKQVQIKRGDAQPLDCPVCMAKMGYKVTDYIKIHYTQFYLYNGSTEDGGQYGDREKIINNGKQARCYNCNKLLPFKINP
jgi:hypothetical protein